MILIFLLIIAVAIILVIGTYNRLVGARNAFKNAFSQIDVQLTRRYDLIPNLVDVAKGYIKHERETLEAVIRARNTAFSGLKTAVRNHVALFRSKDTGLDPKLNVKDIAASFQAAAVDMLVEKTIKAAPRNGVGSVVVAGGVAANSSLRIEMRQACEKNGVKLTLPGMGLCVDNAAMVALAGYLHHQRGYRSDLGLNPRASAAL